MKKEYSTPVITSEAVKIGVFGCYGSRPNNYGEGKFHGGNHMSSGFGFGWLPFALFMRKRKH